MSKNSSDVPRSALSRALIACRDGAVALAARVFNAGPNPRSRQQARRGAFVRVTAARADSSEELALEVWDNDGGHAGKSEARDRFKAGRQGRNSALPVSIYRCAQAARDRGARSDDSRDSLLNACGAVQQQTRCLTIQGRL